MVITNADELRYSRSNRLSISIHLMENCQSNCSLGQNTIEEALMKCAIDTKGLFGSSNGKKLIGMRDPLGIRPLCLGKLGESYVIASESCALDTVGALFEREVEPGEIVIIDEQGVHSIKTMTAAHKALCIFELVYLARPDSVINGEAVTTRREMGSIS